MPALTTFLVPWDYPGLSNKTTTTSPFTIVFKEIGSSMLPVWLQYKQELINCS